MRSGFVGIRGAYRTNSKMSWGPEGMPGRLRNLLIGILSLAAVFSMPGALRSQERERPKETDARERRERERKANENERLGRDGDRLTRGDEKLTRESDRLDRRSESLSREGDQRKTESDRLSRDSEKTAPQES